MSLPAWWQVVTPHRDIRQKSFSEAVFAADLGDVLSRNAPEEYGDPRLFFSKTYLTTGLQNLVRNILSRLTTGQGDPVIQLQTPFGGGKTHSLLSLYHLAQSFAEVHHLEPIRPLVADFPAFAGAQVAVFVGTAADPLKGKTPWGEMAFQLGCYDIIREHDERRVSPGKERIREILHHSGATLFLMDELLEYVVKANQVEKQAKITQGQTLAFLHELSEAVATSPNSVLVLTLPASVLEQYDEEAEKTLAQMQKVLGRVESIYVPVEGMEIYEVLRKRLFEALGDPRLHRQAAESYFHLYQGLGNDVPAEVKETAYREKIERAYPFHPELIDTLYERWGSFPTFQRTRGALRLLAQVVSDLYERKGTAPLIQSSLIDLSYQPVKREFVKHIGNEYDSIISADVTGKARRIDHDMGSEYERYGIAGALATAVFLYSFSGGERRGVSLPWLRVALLREGIPPTIVGDAVSKLEDALWYFHAEKHLYRFQNQPNLNRVIVDREESVREQSREALREQLTRLAKGTLLEAYLWPQSSSDVPDHRRLKLVLLAPELQEGQDSTDAFSKDFIEKAGVAHRIYRNTVFLLALDATAYTHLERQLLRWLALEDIASDKHLALTESAKEELKTRLQQARKDLPFQILTAYRHVGWYSPRGLLWRDMGLPTVGQKSSIADRVLQYLKDEERILSALTPKLIFEKALGEEEQEKSLQEIYEVFLKTPGLPCLEGDKSLIEAVRQGVKTGLLGLRIGEVLHFEEPVFDVPMEALVVRPEPAAQEKRLQAERERQKGISEKGDYPQGERERTQELKETEQTGIDRGSGIPGPSPGLSVKKIVIRASVPWDKLSAIVTGVIRPLKGQGSDPEITLEIQAEAASGFDRTTLDSKVKETLQQVGAEILEWRED